MTDSMSFGRNIRKPVGKWARRFGLSIYTQAGSPINKKVITIIRIPSASKGDYTD